MTIINPKPRFGYDDKNDTIFDYVTNRDIPMTASYATHDGTWDPRKLKDLILKGEQITAALIGPAVAKPAAKPAGATAKPAPAAGTASTQASTAGTAGAPRPAHEPRAVHALTPAELIGLKLSALQAGALGIKPSEMTATGLTAERVKSLKITAERADALKLSEAQRAALAS